MIPADRERTLRRMDANTDKSGACWGWTASLDGRGYAKLWVNGRCRIVSRLTYELHVGPIPAGMEIDHLCRNRRCVNPAHLEPVTPDENKRRARKTHCKRGHEFTPENTYILPPFRRWCRTCENAKQTAYRAKVHSAFWLFMVLSARWKP